MANPEGRVRSQRYARKLECRILPINAFFQNSTNLEDRQRAEIVSKIFREGTLNNLEIDLEKTNNQLSLITKQYLTYHLYNSDNTIFVLNIRNCSQSLRHAEEFLTDIADHARNLAVPLNQMIYSCIGGKKRPCMGCSGRMEGVITNYGQHPGRFWLNTIESQSIEAASRTLGQLVNKPSYVTVCKDGIRTAQDYDSGSDSEEDVNTVVLRRR